MATLPVDAAYPALNLAQSVLLFLYEIRLAARAARPAPTPTPRVRPTHAQLERLFLLGEEALDAIGFFKRSPASAMRTLRQMVYRADLTPTETAMLLAIARQMIYVTQAQGTNAEGE